MVKFTSVLMIMAVVAFSQASVSRHNPNYCYSEDPIRPQSTMHGSQSSYEAHRRSPIDPNASACTPSRFWFVSRHGGRLPNAATIAAMIELTDGPLQTNIASNYNAGRSTLCLDDFNLLREWRADPNITVASADLLTVAGWNTMENLANRYANLFPTLLPRVYNQAQYLFRHTERQRSQGSIRAFADGLFGSNGWQSVTFEPIPALDSFLRPIDFCPAFSSEASSIEPDAFQSGPEFIETLEQVNAKLGFIGSRQLSAEAIMSMWEYCRFETSTDLSTPSAWCSAFSIANNQVLDFHADLIDFYRQSYGVPNRRLVENLNCGLVQDMLRYLQSTNVNDQRARIFGTHSSNLQTLFVTLGVFEDQDFLTRHNIAQQMNRQWRTSWVSPKGTNLAVVRYDCADGDNDVLFLFNERPLQIPGCQANGICKVSFILQRFNRFLNADCPNVFCSSN